MLNIRIIISYTSLSSAEPEGCIKKRIGNEWAFVKLVGIIDANDIDSPFSLEVQTDNNLMKIQNNNNNLRIVMTTRPLRYRRSVNTIRSRERDIHTASSHFI